MRLLRALPKTLWFNFHYLPVAQAWRLPVLISHHVRLAKMKGSVQVDSTRFAAVKIGESRNRLFDLDAPSPVWSVTGKVHFKGRAQLGASVKIVVEGGELIIGEGCTATANLSLHCANQIELGSDCMLSWNVTLIDHDYHHIAALNGDKINHARPIKLGDHVWVGCDCLLLKGTEIGAGCVVAAGSVVSKPIAGENQIIGGSPAVVLKPAIRWYR